MRFVLLLGLLFNLAMARNVSSRCKVSLDFQINAEHSLTKRTAAIGILDGVSLYYLRAYGNHPPFVQPDYRYIGR
jgi:hypothetical protein